MRANWPVGSRPTYPVPEQSIRVCDDRTPMSDREANRFSARAARYARVGANVGGVAARMAGARLLGRRPDPSRNAAALAAAPGGLKGPIMKVAQLSATIPDALPTASGPELQQPPSQAPPMPRA